MSERTSNGPRVPTSAGIGAPGLVVAAGVLVTLTIFFWLTGTLAPDEIPDYASSPREITGMALMLILVPSYMIAATSLGQRRSLRLVEALGPRLPGPGAADDANATIRSGLRRTWPAGIVAGVIMGLMNTQPLDAFESNAPVVQGAVSLGQIIMWCVVGLVMCVRFSSARAFREIAGIIELDILQPDRLKLLSQAGVVDVAIVAGALLLTPLQSIDAEFRWYNYQFGLGVALPAATFFLIWPLQPLHRRNRAERDARLTTLQAQITALGAEAPSTPEASSRLEALLAHRDRLRAVRTWPLSMGLLSRVLLYLVIPPLAWAGAALVERALDRLLGG